MTTIEKCEYFKQKGYTYNPETGEVISHKGKVLKSERWGYLIIVSKINNKFSVLSQHQYAFYMTYGYIPECIDHINRVKDDNRISNLRAVTIQENNLNREAKGYYLHKPSNKFRAEITKENKRIHLGYFTLEEDAKNAYLLAKKKYHNIEWQENQSTKKRK